MGPRPASQTRRRGARPRPVPSRPVLASPPLPSRSPPARPRSACLPAAINSRPVILPAPFPSWPPLSLCHTDKFCSLLCLQRRRTPRSAPRLGCVASPLRHRSFLRGPLRFFLPPPQPPGRRSPPPAGRAGWDSATSRFRVAPGRIGPTARYGASIHLFPSGSRAIDRRRDAIGGLVRVPCIPSLAAGVGMTPFWPHRRRFDAP